MSNSLSKKQLRDFGFLIGIGFPLIIGWIIPSITGYDFRIWTLFIGIPILFIGIISPRFLHRPYQAWMKLGYLLGFINSNVILGIVYIVVLIPTSIFMKAFGYDPLRSKKLKTMTYFERENKKKVDLKKIF